jgi:hypothetical protein
VALPQYAGSGSGSASNPGSASNSRSASPAAGASSPVADEVEDEEIGELEQQLQRYTMHVDHLRQSLRASELELALCGTQLWL